MIENERQAIIEQGQQAKVILDTPLFGQVIDEMRAACMMQLENQRTYDEKAIGAIWRQLKSINMLRENITSKLNGMKMELKNKEYDER